MNDDEDLGIDLGAVRPPPVPGRVRGRCRGGAGPRGELDGRRVGSMGATPLTRPKKGP
jgi:hypothetical protein